MKKVYLSLLLGCLSFLTGNVFAQSSTFGYTGATATFRMPLAATTVTVNAIAGCGGGGYGSSGSPTAVNKGGYISCTLTVTSGQTLYANVGGAGGTQGTSVAGGFNGGGTGGSNYCGGGGGASDVRSVASATGTYSTTPGAPGFRLVVAGGGGGGGDFYVLGALGGGTTGGSGGSDGYTSYGGSQSAGGTNTYGLTSAYGILGVGGNGVSSGGGGGGGYYGGSGGYDDGGGGGGSSYYYPALTTLITNTQGYSGAIGNGQVQILLPATPWAYSSLLSLDFGLVAIGSSSVLTTSFNGINLTSGPITVTAPSGYLVSLSSGGPFATTASLAYSGATLSATTVYVQFNPTGVATYSGNLVFTGGGLPTGSSIPITGIGVAPCTGTPTAGTTAASPTSGGSTTSIALSLSGATVAGGLTYQWQSSPTLGGTYSNIYGATSSTFTLPGISANTYFQCVVGCSFAGVTATSTPVLLTWTGVVASSCTPSSYNSPCSWPAYVGTAGTPAIVTGVTSISDASPCGSGSGGSAYYYNNTSSYSATFYPGGTGYSATMGSTTNDETSGSVWIDFNNDGTFQATELVGGYNNLTYTSTGSREVAAITIPVGTPPGAYRMRLETDVNEEEGPGDDNPYYPAYPQMIPCPQPCCSNYTVYADTRDYTAIIAAPPASVTATPSPIAFGSVTVSTHSVPLKYFALSGTGLSVTPLTITPPANFAVSLDGVTWVSYPATLTVGYPPTYPTSSLSTTNIYVQFNPGPTAGTAYSGNIAITGGNLSAAVNVAVSGSGQAICSGTPTPGTASASTTVANSSSPITLSLSGTSSSGGLTYQWQSSPTSGGTYTNIAGAITPTYNFVGISAATYYQCVVTCPAGSSATSNTVSISLVPAEAASSCTIPNEEDYCSGCYWVVADPGYPLVIAGTTPPGINDAAAVQSGSTSYADMSATQYCTMNSGTTYTATVGGMGGDGIAVQFWIDFNGDGIFQTTERVGGGNIGTSRSNVTLTIPSGVSAGVKRMRVMADYDYSDAPFYYTYPNLPPCPTSTAPYYYEVRDYAVIFGTAPPTNAPACAGTPNPGIISTSQTASCGAFSPSLFNVGETIAATGIKYQWQSASSAVGPWASISGATGQGYVASVSSTVYYRDSTTCINGNASAATPPQQLIINVAPTITGTAVVCSGLTTTLNATPSGGTWSSASANATVGSTSGVVTGVNPSSTAVITYTAPTSCINTTIVTVNTNPAVPGTASVCQFSTTTLLDASGGGTWSSGNTALATIGSSSGTVTGVAAGSPNITFTLTSTGCYSSTPITVNSAAAILGTPSICIGYTTSLSASIAGGTWSSSDESIATINSSGLVTSVALGAATISYITPGTGCVATQVVNVTNPPSTFSMTGGGSYCSGTGGVHVGINGSNVGISYQLVNSITGAVGGLVSGTGYPIDFGLVTAAGTYTVEANPGTPCAAYMTGSSVVTILPLPTSYAVTGGGGYCPGGTGVNVYLNNSAIGINYQLFVGGVPVGVTVAGSGSPINFGLQTTAGAYTVVGTNGSTGCISATMTGATVSVNPAPASFNVTGTNQFCVGGTGVHVGLNGSVAGTTSYQLTLGGFPTGAPVVGTGSAIDFGLVTTGGTYNVVATLIATGCTATMSGSAVITVNPLPTVYTVTGGGGYCATTTQGVPVGLNGSTIGVNYQLYYTPSAGTASPVGGPVPGTGVALTFAGPGTSGTFLNTGSYTVVATNPTTTCSNNMFGSASVFTNPLPQSFTVTGGGAYCVGGAGMPVNLSGSVSGTTYQLLDGLTIVGAASGTGSALVFGVFPATGTYTVVASTPYVSAATCTATMSGSATITTSVNPIAYNVTAPTGNTYCAGGTGVAIGLNGSNSGVSYQLYSSGIVDTTVTGLASGAAISFGLRQAGAYTVVATTTTLPTCTSNMTGSANIIANPLPTIYSVTGGGGYCNGSTPVHVGLSSSNTGVTYSLVRGVTLSTLPGIGGALDFGTEAVAGTYTILATNVTTTCTVNMAGSAIVNINSLPNNTYSITDPDGNQYCFGGAGVHLGTNNSDNGINYQLMNGGVPAGAPVSGIVGTALNFGLQTAAGIYTVLAYNATTTCSVNLSNSVAVVVNPLPTVFSVTGGGQYCAGASGVHVGLSASTSGVSYQLMNGMATVGAPVTGSGAAIDFGPVTSPVGTTTNYTVVATSAAPANCGANMAGYAAVTQNPAPVSTYVITGGGAYCNGGSGLPIGLFSSSPGINYQLMSLGMPVGSPMAGTGVALNFGIQAAGGAYTVVGTNATTGCSATMTGTATITISSLPAPFALTGGGNYCPGGAGKLVGLASSVSGTSYQLFNGSSPAGTAVTGTGTPINFGLQTATGSYTVVATNGCTGNMPGSVTIGLYTLPAAYNVTGGGQYCPGGAGVVVGLSGSNTGMSYQLLNGAGPVGTALSGTGFSLNFGPQTASGTYTIVGSNTTTSCSSNMSGSAVVVVSTPPTVFNVTGGGNYCSASAGVAVGLDGSSAGTSYQLHNGVGSVGSPVPGTGTALNLGIETAPGTYTVIATSSSTTCSSAMAGSTTIAILPLPAVHTLSSGGNYCAGTGGVDVTLSSSDAGVTYQLYNGTTAMGAAISGSGLSLNFGNQSVAGNYTVIGTDNVSHCSNTMSGVSVIGVSALPTAYTISGGGNYCATGTGMHVMLSGSNTGVSYQLKVSGVPTGGAIAGTGSSLDFGPQTTGGSYTIVATNIATGCTNTMTGAVTVSVNALPAVYTITSSGSNYCEGGTGIDIQLSGSDAGIRYQLYNGSTTSGSAVVGTGFDLDMGVQAAAGVYTVVAMNPVTGCNNTMASAATIIIDPKPNIFTVVGGGNYCNGGTGVHVGISGSNTGISYQLVLSGVNTGTPVPGNGFALDFGLESANGSYTVIATNSGSTCSDQMSGSATVTSTPLPTVYSVTGGGNYCAGGAGTHVGLSGSTAGVNYQLYNGVSLTGAPVTGTGVALDFGLQTATGSYTVMAINATTSCSNLMAGGVTVGTNALPTAYTITGGGNFCPGSDGVHIGLSGSASGISYQLFNGSALTGTAVAGTGSPIDFGAITPAGTYTIVATNPSTTCTNNMSGTVSVGLNPLPVVYSVIGGGNYCATGVGVHVGLNSSSTGINYQLWDGGATVGFPVSGTGGPLDFGLQTAAGTYTVVASNGATSCTNNMSGTATIAVNALVTPAVNISTGVGNTVCSGHAITLSTTVTNGGTAPTFVWSVNGSPVAGTGSTYSYLPTDGDIVSVSVTSNATCATPPTVGNSFALTVLPNGNPTVSIAATPASEVCKGTMVTFNNSNAFGGTPSFTWIVDGANVSSAASYSYTPTNGDLVYVIMTSNYRCRLENAATSNQITMAVDDSLIPIVTIAAYPGRNIAHGQSLTLTATVINGGPAPLYQWFINGVAVSGANSPSYTSSNFNNNDSVTCEAVSSGGCSGLSGFNSVRISVNGATGVNQVVSSGSDINLVPNPNKGIFTIKGTLGTTNDEEVSVEISDMLGQVIYKDKVMVHGGNIDQKIQLNGSIANGMYILNLRSESANDVFHVVIEQ